MSQNLRKSQRGNAGKTKNYDDYVQWSLAPRRTTRGIQNAVQSEPDFLTVEVQSLDRNVSPHTVEEPRESRFQVGSSKAENRDVAVTGSSKVSDSARQSTRKSERSKVSSSKRVEIEKRRLALETEVTRAELMIKKQELENQMRILDRQKELAEAEIEEEELYTIQSGSSRKLSIESVGESTKNEGVQEWVDKCEMHSVHFPYKESEKEVVEEIQKAETSHDNDLSKLCHVMADAFRKGNENKDFPFFDGKPEDWPLFISQYNRKTKMYHYSEDEVMVKLQKCLKGEALEAVRSLLLHPRNISRVIDTLEMRFGRPEYVIGSLISKTQQLQFVREGDFNNFIKFSCHINNLVATLEQFEASNHLENPFLLEQLVSKIPNSLKLQWGQVTVQKRGKVNLKDFGTWTNEVSAAACYVSPNMFTSYNQKKSCNNSRPENVMVTTNQTTDEQCPYCSEVGHTIFNCSILKNDSIDVRWSKIKKTKICFCCLKNGHSKRFCRSKQHCTHDGCKLRHHTLLHKNTNTVSCGVIPTKNSDESVQTVCLTNDYSKVLLRIAPIKIYGPKGHMNTYALFDEGSTISLIDNQTAELLGLSGKIKPLCMQWANNMVSHDDDSKSLDMEISGVHEGARIFKMNGLRTVGNLSLPSQTIIMDNFKNLVHLKDLPIKDMIEAKPTVLIGQDNIHLTVARKVYQGPENSPVATKTNLGWVLHGNTSGNDQNSHQYNLCICSCNEDELNRLVKESFSTESFGVNKSERNIDSAQRRATDILEKTTKYLDNEKRFETGLIWKNDDIKLPESKSNAFKRLLCIERKMLKNKSYFDQYCQKIEDYLKKGYIIKLNDSEVSNQSSRIWYLPHFGVVNPNKPNKLRLVFDAAARSHGTSLNDNLLQGPDYLSLLPGVLMRFRRFRWGFCGDIAEMFHQVKIRKEDRCAQRFLWRNGDQSREADVYELQVMMFGASCSPCSAQYVKNLNARRTKFPDLIKDVERNFYVDDYLDSCITEQEALTKIERIIELHKNGGFNIVNWSSNSPLVIEKFGNEHVEKYFNKSQMDRILGLWWDVKSDSFTFRVVFHKVPENIVNGSETPTKRQVLQLVMSIFDPLGFLTCLSIKGRIILQMIWRSGIGWDDAIPKSIHNKWLDWLGCLQVISSVRIPRCYCPILADATAIEIHVFCDASEEAFAVIAYLRIVFETHIEVSFITAKARVSPLKPISIPRLELQAAVMGSRLLHTISKEIDLSVTDSFLWTDSKTVLYWIEGDGRNYKQFVAHRIGEIQELTVVAQWKYVPTDLNVADEATRITNSGDIGINYDSRWFRGPDFLSDSKNWPPKFEVPVFQVDDENERKSENFVGFITSSYDHLPKVKRFSKWRKLVRSTAWVLRFCRRLLGKIRKEKEITIGELTLKEIDEAKKLCLERSQEESFGNDIHRLKRKKQVDKNSRLYNLSAFIDDDGILKMQTRISQALCLDESTRKPVILDPKNATVILLLQFYHEKHHHQGNELILNDIRQEYWVIKGRQAVKNTFYKCLYCRLKKSKPNAPKMGNLPTMRLTSGVKPFSHTGVDYFGPLYVTVGRHKEKRWGVLFTCMTIRAIHLEIAHSLTADGTIMAIRRMISRRGRIQNLYSDNGTNFRGANEELIKYYRELDHQKITREMTEMEIEWHFIPPGSPHMGGCWERLIGSVKKILGVTLKEEYPKDETLLTLFAEAEYVVNSRPLTYVSADPTDPQCLTPNHLLIGSPSKSPFPVSFEDQNMRKQWKNSQRLADIFWLRWIKEYLPTLSRRAKWIKDGKPVAVGDLVVVAEGNLPRNSWPLGRVTAVFPGRDEVVRVVEVKTSTGTYKRPVTKICKMDFENGEDI